MNKENTNEETVSTLAINHTGPAITNFDPLLYTKPLKRQPRKLRDIIARDFKNERKSDKG